MGLQCRLSQRNHEKCVTIMGEAGRFRISESTNTANAGIFKRGISMIDRLILSAAVLAFVVCAAPAGAEPTQAAQAAQQQAGQPSSDQQQPVQKSQRKQSKKQPTTQQQVDQSVQSGTVPAKYRSSVPKQYQQYVPFAR
jgi:hypothetical protein